MSFYYAQKFDLDLYDQYRIVGDSGAYSARTQGLAVSNDELGEWANKWKHRLFWVAALDVSGDQRTTRKNWHYLNSHYDLQSIPSIHFADNPRAMDYYVERGCDFIGLGGLAGGGANPKAQMRWLIQVFKYAQRVHPHVRFHGWGLTTQNTMKLPFWSVDSSSWGSSYRYGTAILRNPDTYARVTYRTDGRDAYRPEVATLLRTHYGTTPGQVALSTAETRPSIVRVSALAASVYEQHMRHLHRPGISPPQWGIMSTNGRPTTGPHVALADSATATFDILNSKKKADQ